MNHSPSRAKDQDRGKNMKKILFIISITITAIGFIVTFVVSKSQSQSLRSSVREDIPIVEYYAPVQDEASDKIVREERSRKYEKGTPIQDNDPNPEILDL